MIFSFFLNYAPIHLFYPRLPGITPASYNTTYKLKWHKIHIHSQIYN